MDRMPIRWLPLMIMLGCATPLAQGAGVVIANRAASPVRFRLTPVPEEAAEQQGVYTLESADLVTLAFVPDLIVGFRTGEEDHFYPLKPNAVYFFAADESGRVDMHEIGYGQGKQSSPDNAPMAAAELPAVGIIPVKILVDEDEQATREVWEARLRKRLERASDIIEKHCRIRFEVVAVDTWESNDFTQIYSRSLSEFESDVDPHPARLAIGFTSQYRRPDRNEREMLGGIRGPFRRHILLREWPQHHSEWERMEVLVHELGHFLGAVHSPEIASVMRPVLGDRQANAVEFRIGFDPLNSMVMYLIGEELRGRRISALRQVTPTSRVYLRRLYHTLHKALPRDPAAAIYLERLEGVPAAQPASNKTGD